MLTQQSDIAMAKQGVRIVQTGFEDFSDAFATITQRAFLRFETRDWHGMRRDTVERLDLYPQIVNETVGMLNGELGSAAHRTEVWTAIRSQFLDICRQG